MKPPRLRYIVTVRLSADRPFKLLEVNGKHDTYDRAQFALEQWYAGVRKLPKAKPEAMIDVEELPHLEDCRKCGYALYKGQVVQYTRDGVYCYDCSKTEYDGYYDFLEESQLNPKFSLDKHIPV